MNRCSQAHGLEVEKAPRCLGLGVALLILLAGMAPLSCGNFSDVPEFPQDDQVSGCGGFGNSGFLLYDVPPINYCDAEVLYWNYEPSTETLKLLDARVLLNCCGDHSMVLGAEDGTFVVTEIDSPENGGARCACMCVYDYSLTAEGIPLKSIQMKIVREVYNDDPEIKTVFEGKMDLSLGSGVVILDETDVYPWCGVN